jgi:hypothetical protein
LMGLPANLARASAPERLACPRSTEVADRRSRGGIAPRVCRPVEPVLSAVRIVLRRASESEMAAPAAERLACRRSAGGAGRRIPAGMAPLICCRAERAWPVGPIAWPVAAPETMEWRLDLPDRRDLSRRVLPEDLASGSQSLSSQPKEAAKAQAARRRRPLLRLPLPPPLQRRATRLAMVRSERRQVSLPEKQFEVRGPEPA